MISEGKRAFIQQTANDYGLDFDLVLQTYETEFTLADFYYELELYISNRL